MTTTPITALREATARLATVTVEPEIDALRDAEVAVSAVRDLMLAHLAVAQATLERIRKTADEARSLRDQADAALSVAAGVAADVVTDLAHCRPLAAPPTPPMCDNCGATLAGEVQDVPALCQDCGRAKEASRDATPFATVTSGTTEDAVPTAEQVQMTFDATDRAAILLAARLETKEEPPTNGQAPTEPAAPTRRRRRP